MYAYLFTEIFKSTSTFRDLLLIECLYIYFSFSEDETTVYLKESLNTTVLNVHIKRQEKVTLAATSEGLTKKRLNSNACNANI